MKTLSQKQGLPPRLFRSRLGALIQNRWERFVAAAVIGAFIIGCVGCGSSAQSSSPQKEKAADEQGVHWHDYLGPEIYLDSLVALTWEGDEDGIVGVRHRVVEDLPGLVGNAEVPIVVIFYDHLAEHAHHLIAGAESLAEFYRAKACILLVTPDAEVPLFADFDRQLLPTTYCIMNGSRQDQLQGWDDEVIQSIREFIESNQKDP